jgi:hypothetical protein
MSLPADEQWVLDRIETGLKSSAPRLASMYAIFARLFGDEERPRREQLERRSFWPWAGPMWLRAVCRLGPRSAIRVRRAGRRTAVRLRVMALVLLAVGAVVGGVVIGARTTAARACGAVVLVRVPPRVIGSPGKCAAKVQSPRHAGVGHGSHTSPS